MALSWAGVPAATSYFVELATDAGFANVVGSQNVNGPTANFGTLAPIAIP